MSKLISNKYKLLIILPLMLCAVSAVAQQTVTGTVTDASTSEILPGVNILVKGTSTGASTDANGQYEVSVESLHDTLIVSFIGYKTQQVSINGRTEIDVALQTQAISGEEMVVVGYGTQKKGDLTGSISSVSAEELTSFPTTDAIRGLQGKTAGVRVIENSGAPGANTSVRIRGGNSLLGNNEPLYVVDGFALTGNPNAVNPNDIESIEVLKDASATAIYGSRGANGVVLITTKSGSTNGSQVNVHSYFGIQQVAKTIDMMNASEFARLANERASNEGRSPYFTQDGMNAFDVSTNWQDLLFQTAPMQNHDITFSGGDENTQYSVSGSYLGQEGIIKNSNLSRLSLRAKLSQQINDKIKLSYNSIVTNSNLKEIDNHGQKGGTILSAVLVAPPTVSPYNKEGDYSFVRRYDFSPNELQNPLAMANGKKQKLNTKYFLGKTAINYEPVKNVTLKSSVGVEAHLSKGNNYSSSILDDTPTGEAKITSTQQINLLNENTVTYNTQFNQDHELTVLGGITYQQVTSENFNTGTVTGFQTDELETNSLQSGRNFSSPASGTEKWSIFSYLARVNYSYKNTYLLTASIRSDGSSRFGEGNKWGYFPSAALAWRAINEDFVSNLSFISDLKFRLSWGITGNTAIRPYQTLNALSSYQIVLNNERQIGYAPSLTDLANSNLKWETTAQYNLGMDMGFLHDRLNVTLDFYRKDTKDLLSNIQLPTSTGYSNSISNIGKIKNSGIELGLDAIILNKAFMWNMNVNISKNKNEVIRLADGSDVYGQEVPQPLSAAVNLVREGRPVGVFYGFLEDGLDEDGGIKYKDLDGENGITSDDRTIIGDPNPDFIYSISSNMSYKNFELSYFIQGEQGGDIFNVNLSAVGNSFYFGENQLEEVYYNHWSPSEPDPNAKYPKITSSNFFRPSDRYVEDGSYLRLKNVQLAYNLPVTKIGVSWLKNMKVYVSGKNLITITKYSWYDPAVNTYGGSNSISMGIDNAAYPNTRMYTFGVNLGF